MHHASTWQGRYLSCVPVTWNDPRRGRCRLKSHDTFGATSRDIRGAGFFSRSGRESSPNAGMISTARSKVQSMEPKMVKVKPPRSAARCRSSATVRPHPHAWKQGIWYSAKATGQWDLSLTYRSTPAVYVSRAGTCSLILPLLPSPLDNPRSSTNNTVFDHSFDTSW